MFNLKIAATFFSAALFASAGFAADVSEPETPGSAGPKIVAETIHNARIHGISDATSQLEAQASSNPTAQAISEAIHLRRQHGKVNDSADQRMMRDASRL